MLWGCDQVAFQQAAERDGGGGGAGTLRRVPLRDREPPRRPCAIAGKSHASIFFRGTNHPGVELRANLKSISHRCHLFEVAFVWELTKESIHLPLGCLQGGQQYGGSGGAGTLRRVPLRDRKPPRRPRTDPGKSHTSVHSCGAIRQSRSGCATHKTVKARFFHI